MAEPDSLGMGDSSGGQDQSVDTGAEDTGQDTIVIEGEDGGESDQSGEPDRPAARSAGDDRFSAYERRIAQLEASIKANAQQQLPQAKVPACFQKNQNLWTIQDWAEYNNYMIDQRLQAITAEQRAKGLYNATALGPGNDYDTTIRTYLEPIAEKNPEIQPFLNQLPPEDRYMLALMHEVHAKSGGNLINTIKAIRNALGARVAGSKDVINAITQGQKRGALTVFQGGGGHQTQRREYGAADINGMSDEEFRKFDMAIANKRRG